MAQNQRIRSVDALGDNTVIATLGGWFGEAFPILWLAKILGALTGSIVSLAYVMPRGRREAASRLLVGVVTGLIFGGTAGVKLADTMGLLGKVSAFEITLMGATLASLSAWWGLGALQRLLERWTPSQGSEKRNTANDAQ